MIDTDILKEALGILRIVEKEFAVQLKEKYGILFDEYDIANIEVEFEKLGVV
jgi:hypothetical protein